MRRSRATTSGYWRHLRRVRGTKETVHGLGGRVGQGYGHLSTGNAELNLDVVAVRVVGVVQVEVQVGAVEGVAVGKDVVVLAQVRRNGGFDLDQTRGDGGARVQG